MADIERGIYALLGEAACFANVSAQEKRLRYLVARREKPARNLLALGAALGT